VNFKSFLVALLLCLYSPAANAQKNDFCELMMRSTFKISGPNTIGSVFILGRPDEKNPGKAFYVLITAAHVLDEIPTDTATLSLRIKEGSSFQKVLIPIRIRNSGVPLWLKHPLVDVVAMYLAMPEKVDIPLVPTTWIATDQLLEEKEIQPGDELFIAGFPLGAESGSAGFPILRSGRIANYPITPIGSNPVFLLDFVVFPGNSGGPVFLNSQNRFYKGGTNIGISRMIVGIISQELKNVEQINSLTETTLRQHPLSVAVAVHAQFVKELIDSLPVPK